MARVLNVQSESVVTFGDASDIPSWAVKEIAALTELGLISNRSNGLYDPNGQVTRTEI